jgi:ATP-dependent HslUV protease subunit HslV
MSEIIHATTVLCVRRGNQVAMASDGQVTLGNTVVKSQAKKVRKMAEGRVLGGFAGSAADGIALFERLEAKLKEHNQQLCGRRSSWPKTGGPIGRCDGWKR